MMLRNNLISFIDFTLENWLWKIFEEFSFTAVYLIRIDTTSIYLFKSDLHT